MSKLKKFNFKIADQEKIFTISQVFQHLNKEKNLLSDQNIINGYRVSIDRKIKLYAKLGVKCLICGKTGLFFTMINSSKKRLNKLQLWTLDDNNHKIRMNLDHIIPKCRMRIHDDSNYTVMCQNCNSKKSDTPIKDFFQTDYVLRMKKNNKYC